MTIEVTLQLDPIDFDEPAIDATVAALDSYMFARAGGVSTVTVFSEANPLVDAVVAIHLLRQHGIGVVGVKEDPVNAPEIALRSHVSRQAVAKWIERDDFPPPFASLADQRLWHWAHVLKWLKDVKGMPFEEELPDDDVVAEINSYVHKQARVWPLPAHPGAANLHESRFACEHTNTSYAAVTAIGATEQPDIRFVSDLHGSHLLFRYEEHDSNQIEAALWSSKPRREKKSSDVY